MMKESIFGGLLLMATLSAQALVPQTEKVSVPGRSVSPDFVVAEKIIPCKDRPAKANEATDEWTFIGEGTMTDFVVGDLFWTSSKSFPVTIEQSKSDPNTYRIPHPYANWSDPAIKQYVKYDASKETPMVIHIYNGTYAWFEEFDTGLNIDLTFAGFPDKGELTVKMWGEDLIKENGIQLVAAEGASSLCAFTDGILSLGAFGKFQNMSKHNILCDIGGKSADSDNYYVANYNGEFRITMPSSSEDAEWKYLGTGSMTESVFSSMFGLAPKIVNVEVEQSIVNPSLYRIKAPYAAWYDAQLKDYCTYEESMASPMIIHLEEGNFAWIENFSTGVYLNYTGSDISLKGNVNVSMQAEPFITQYGFIYVANHWPDVLCKYSDGTVTLGKSFSLDGKEYSNLLFSVGKSEDKYTANNYGNFSIKLPINGNNDDADWESIGYAEYTDDLMTMFNDPSAPIDPQTWTVELQQYKTDPTMYRLINPYSGWNSPYSDVMFDDSKDYHIVVYTLPSRGMACIGDFETGMNFPGLGMMGITTDAYYFSLSYGLDFTANVMPELFADFNGKEITYPAHITLEGEKTPAMMAWFGSYSDENLYHTNKSGKFKIKFLDTNGIEDVAPAVNDLAPEYYTLQGIRVRNVQPGQIVIERRGNTYRKRILK